MKSSGFQRGFSLVELIVVIMLLGIVGSVVLARMVRSDSYDAIIVRDQVISLARLAQQHAIGRTDVVLVLEPAGNDVNIRVEAGESTARQVIQGSQRARRQVLLSGDVNQLSSCALQPGQTSLEPGNRFELRFDTQGNLATAGIAPGGQTGVTHGARLCINDTPALSVCWSPSGYAYAGDCID